MHNKGIYIWYTNWLTDHGTVSWTTLRFDFDGLVQERCISSAIAMELCLSCTHPYIQSLLFRITSILQCCKKGHYTDVIMSALASQITSLPVVYSVYSGSEQRKHQSSASLAFVRGIHWWLVNSPQKGPVTQKQFPFDDIIMYNTVQVIAIQHVTCPINSNFLEQCHVQAHRSAQNIRS